jgi:glycosyltransferase involved in cell wall biosynthesis
MNQVKTVRNRQMRIAQLAPLAESVPPKGYGGSEQVVSDLTEELVMRGHQVTLFATEGSETSGHLVTCAPAGLRQSDIAPSRWGAYDLRSLLRLEKMAGQFDIIHNHMGYSALPLLRQAECPVVTTIHNPIKDYCAEIFLACSSLSYVSISDAYRRLNYPKELNYVATVYNGINIDSFHFEKSMHRTYLLFVGRLCQDKGTLEAIQIAKRVKQPIILAGKVDNNDREYFETSIKPLLDDVDVKYIGEVTGQEKSTLYSAAIATLCPIAFEEPFGLVLAESNASGTPVLAFRRGAVPEVIADGVTGIIGDTVDDLVDRFGELQKIDLAACRLRAEQLFSKERMAERYEEVYKQLLSRVRPSGQLQEVLR